jgi:drug/metabolite transporter, DME family
LLVGVLLVTLAAASWGTWSLFLVPTHLPWIVTSALVFAMMGLAALPFVRGRVTWDRRLVTLLLLNTAFDALNIVAFFAAMANTTVAIAVLTHYAAPIIIALAAPRIDGVSARGVGPAAAVALIGLVVVLEPWQTQADGALVGGALGLVSACCYAGNVFCVRRLAGSIGAIRALSYHSLIAAAILLPFAASGLPAVTGADLGYLAAGSVTIGAVSGVVYAVGLLRIGSARSAVLTFAEPLVAVAVGALWWHQPLHPIAAVGGALVIGAGVYVARRAQ